jgi:hypothetical protein
VKLCPVSGKRQYRTHGDAMGCAASYLADPAVRFRHDAPTALRAYKCPHCGFWHWTNRAKRIKGAKEVLAQPKTRITVADFTEAEWQGHLRTNSSS